MIVWKLSSFGARACLKNHSRNLHAPLCGIFCPNSVAVARYGSLIRTKSPTNCDAHLAESLFQTRSRTCLMMLSPAFFAGWIMCSGPAESLYQQDSNSRTAAVNTYISYRRTPPVYKRLMIFIQSCESHTDCTC